MHRALQIPEILLNIFSHVFCPPLYRGTQPWWPNGVNRNPDMVTLARTCRAFKEPALDILWSVLQTLSPIASCLPDALPRNQVLEHRNTESAAYILFFLQSTGPRKFSRALSQDELHILRSYTRRVRSIMDLDMEFDWDSVRPRTIREDIIQDPLFPNLRFLSCRLPHGTLSSPPHQYAPTLVSIAVDVTNGPRLVGDYLRSFSELYPNLKKIIVSAQYDDDEHARWHDNPSYSPRGAFTWPWRDLQVLSCPEYELDMVDLRQLSRLPALTELTFSPSYSLLIEDIPNLSSPFIFPNLQNLGFSRVIPNKLESFSGLLSQMELPVIAHLNVDAMSFSSERVSPFLAAVQNANVNCSIEHLTLYHEADAWIMQYWDYEPVLTPDDLRLTMAFSNLRHLDLQVAAYVSLADSGLLELASAWPQIEYLAINKESGWNGPETVFGGITPDGLVQLLQTCPLLNYIALAIDTRGFTANANEALDLLPTTSSKSHLQTIFRIDVLNSIIKDKSAPAMANWLADFVRPYPGFHFRAWRVCACLLYSDIAQIAYEGRWETVYCSANTILERSKESEDSFWRESWPIGVCVDL